jgi:hypothetical protein
MILAISLMVVYLASMAPGLSWANFGADGGDLITAAATGGIAHPTGYPLYLLLARLFQLWPIGSLAFRTNLMSACAAVAAAVLVYGLVTRVLSHTDPKKNWFAGLASGFAFGLSPLLWSQAVVTEVYALNAFFTALIFSIYDHPISPKFSQKRKDVLLGLTLGLAMGNHITIILFLPIIILVTILHQPTVAQGKSGKKNLQIDGRSLLRRSAWLGVGLLIYIILPLRALSQPPVNWGNPVNFENFLWLVSGKLYQSQLFTFTLPFILERMRFLVALLLDQFGIPGLAIGLTGLIVFFRPTRLNFGMLWIVSVFSVFAVVYSTTDAFMYLIPAFLCFSVWIGIGLGGLMDATSLRYRWIGPLIGSVFILALFIQAGYHWPQVDASRDQRAELFCEDVLRIAPANAIVFAKSDRAVFSLWYYLLALQERPDLAVVATDLLQFDWYQQTLHSRYPDLNVPGPFPFAETVAVANSERPVCYVRYIQMTEISCFPARDPK